MKTVCRLVLVRTEATASVRQGLVVQRQGAGMEKRSSPGQSAHHAALGLCSDPGRVCGRTVRMKEGWGEGVACASKGGLGLRHL